MLFRVAAGAVGMAFDMVGRNAERRELCVGDARKIDMGVFPEVYGECSEWMIGFAILRATLPEGGADTDERVLWGDVPFSLEDGKERLNGGLLAPTPTPSPVRGRGEFPFSPVGGRGQGMGALPCGGRGWGHMVERRGKQTPPPYMEETDNVLFRRVDENLLAVCCTHGEEETSLVRDESIRPLRSLGRFPGDDDTVPMDLPERGNIFCFSAHSDVRIGMDIVCFGEKENIDGIAVPLHHIFHSVHRISGISPITSLVV